MKETYILGVKVNTGLTMSGVLNHIDGMLSDGGFHYISTTNPEFIMDAQKDREFMSIINESDLSVPDGSGVLYAEYYLEKAAGLKRDTLLPLRAFVLGLQTGFDPRVVRQFPPKITGVDLVYKICEYAEMNNKSIFLLGGRKKDSYGRFIQDGDDIATLTADALKILYPRLRVIGSTSSYSCEDEDDADTVRYIKGCMVEHSVSYIDFLLVAYGHVRQEKWIDRNGYKIPAKVSVGVGGTFDYVCSNKKRSANVFIKVNIEWLYKLITQPWRIKRIYKAFPAYPLKVFITSIRTS
ncbi:hypothetical protein A2976_02330 [candidate division WWE3 bacterium RIFCSPLOWO2_01_FULL_41_9]|uniref:Uncharacterized protein n=1 Tax=candidate division WWE3 bacterium RIFCSPLOWO2_01_FULL_41_9 TaxID=1802626 RepID=A0A1F4VJK3_UNCKA|nr:MAG: hypothetical protein A2976_02330 [candidate division WWE3 bacterium RIFCSPLOWO2_01_FULL_41_9]